MDNRANEAYLTAIINDYERQINKGVKTVGNKETFLKDVVTTLGSLLDFMMDKTVTDSKSTLELNKDLIENVKAYKISLAVERRVVDSLKIDLNDKIMDLHKNGYIEQENIRLEADNLKLKSQLSICNVNQKIITDLKSDIQMWQAQCIELREKIEKLTGPTWWID